MKQDKLSHSPIVTVPEGIYRITPCELLPCIINGCMTLWVLVSPQKHQSNSSYIMETQKFVAVTPTLGVQATHMIWEHEVLSTTNFSMREMERKTI